jgi:hypothetical protein
MNTNFNNIENLYTDSFKDFKVEPSSKVWTNIQKRLKKKNFFHFSFVSLNIYSITIMAGLLLTALIYFFPEKNFVPVGHKPDNIITANSVVDTEYDHTNVRDEKTKIANNEDNKEKEQNHQATQQIQDNPEINKTVSEKQQNNLLAVNHVRKSKHETNNYVNKTEISDIENQETNTLHVDDGSITQSEIQETETENPELNKKTAIETEIIETESEETDIAETEIIEEGTEENIAIETEIIETETEETDIAETEIIEEGTEENNAIETEIIETETEETDITELVNTDAISNEDNINTESSIFIRNSAGREAGKMKIQEYIEISDAEEIEIFIVVNNNKLNETEIGMTENQISNFDGSNEKNFDSKPLLIFNSFLEMHTIDHLEYNDNIYLSDSLQHIDYDYYYFSKYKWSLDLYYSTLYSSPIVENRDAEYNQMSLLKDNAKQPITYYSIGCNANCQYGKWIFQSGLLYSKIGERFDYSFEKTNVDGTISQISYQSDNKYHYIEIPIIAGYTLPGNMVNYTLKAGIVNSIFITAKGKTISVDDSQQVLDIDNNLPFARTAFAIQLSIGVTFKLNDRINLLAEPYYRYSLKSVYKKDYQINQRYRISGIRLGVRYIF